MGEDRPPESVTPSDGVQREHVPVASSVPLPAQSRARGILYVSAGWVVLVLGGFLILFALGSRTAIEVSSRLGQWIVFLVPFFLGMILFSHGSRLIRRGRQEETDIISSPDEIGKGPFVLYLRSFDDDPQWSSSQTDRPSGCLLGSGIITEIFLSTRTDEEQLAAALLPIGPMVAVGQPGEKLPILGARRFYLPINGWQNTIRDLMSRAQLVVLAIGSGDGLMWELEEAIRTLPPERLVLIVAMEREQYEEFRESVRRRFHSHAESGDHESSNTSPSLLLPEYPDDRVLLRMNIDERVRIKGAIVFEENWVPRFVCFSRPDTHTNERNAERLAFERNLLPVLRRNRPY
jgi:hypothetical protein